MTTKQKNVVGRRTTGHGARKSIGTEESQKEKRRKKEAEDAVLSKVVLFLWDDDEGGNNQKHFQPAWSASWKMQKTKPSHQISYFKMVQKFCHNKFF